MVYLAAALVLVGVVCLLNLVLTIGVIRRLRVHTSLLGEVSHAMPAEVGLPVGEPVGEFVATTTAGQPVSREALTGRMLVGFFSPGCQPCAEQLPRFVAYAESLSDGQALAVVAGGVTEVTGYVERLAPVARVVSELPDGPVQAAFRVTGFPTVYLIDDGGVVAAAGVSMDALPDAAHPITELAGARSARAGHAPLDLPVADRSARSLRSLDSGPAAGGGG